LNSRQHLDLFLEHYPAFKGLIYSSGAAFVEFYSKQQKLAV